MRLLFTFILLSMSSFAMADQGESQTFFYDGTQSSIKLSLNGEKTHTEYRPSQVSTICYRQELAGYRTVCPGGVGYYGGYYGPRYNPYPYTGVGLCQQYPLYRSVSYPCTQTVDTPYQVKDYDVEAQVSLDIKNIHPEIKAGETFKISLNGDQLQISATGSRSFLIVLNKQDIRNYMSGSVKLIDARYSVELVPAEATLSALRIDELTDLGSTIGFKMGQVYDKSNFGVKLTILKRRFLASKLNVFDKELNSGEFDFVSSDVETNVNIDLNKAGVNLQKGRYFVIVKVGFRPNGTLMNMSQFSGRLEVSNKFKKKSR